MSQSFNIDNPNSFNHQFVSIDYVDEGPKEGPLLVLVHGFPELWYFWKHQIKFLVSKNYRVVTFDMPGYGQTQVPDALKHFSYKESCEDINHIVTKHLNREKAIFIGHDWGSLVVWYMTLYFPTTVQALISLSIPYDPPSNDYTTDEERVKALPFLQYQLVLKNANIEKLDQNLEDFLYAFYSFDQREISMDKMNAPLDSIETIVSNGTPGDRSYPPKDLMEYVLTQYRLQGLKGPTNWYRTTKVNHDYLKEFVDAKVSHKALLILGKHDFTTLFKDRGEPYCENLTTKIIEGKHFIQINNYQEVNDLMEEFLNSLDTDTKILP